MNTDTASTDTARVLGRDEAGCAIVTINQPQRRNALDAETRQELIAALEAAFVRPGIAAILIEGDSRAFCAGGDLASMGGMTAAQAAERIAIAHRLPRTIINAPRPVIAVVEGVCAGAGLGLATVCDLIVAGESATFVTAFEKVGLMPDFGVAWALGQRMGVQSAKRLLMFGGALGGREAQEHGLADFCVPAGEAHMKALDLAAQLGRNAPATLRTVRDLFRAMPLDIDAVLAFEAERQAVLYRSADVAEGIAAFREKRRPVWRDA